MDDGDLRLRRATYAMVVEVGRPPRVDEVAEALGAPVDEVQAGWWRLHEGHAVVLHPNGEIRMANPFSAVPTAYRVHAGGRSWFGNCAWDAFGICAALQVDGEIETACAECGEAISVAVRAQEPDDASLRFHCLVPAARWWDDIAYT